MTTREFFIRQFQAERPKFLRVLRALPEGRLDYRPHERSSSASMIAWFLVLELRALVDVATKGENHWQQLPAVATAAEMAAEYEKAALELEEALASSDEKAWEREARMYVGGKVVIARPMGELIWDFFFDALHHRGQLTAYLRPMGGKVPALYGPSGDEK